MQFLAAPDGTPLWTSDVEPVSTYDLIAARVHVLPGLYRAGREGLPRLADSGYEGAGIGVNAPVKKPAGQSADRLHADVRAYNALLRGSPLPGRRLTPQDPVSVPVYGGWCAC